MGGSLAVAGARRAARQPARRPSCRRASAPARRPVDTDRLLGGGASVPGGLSAGVQAALADALHSVFLAAVPLGLVALLLAVALPELPLRTWSHQGARRGPSRRKSEPRPYAPDRGSAAGHWAPSGAAPVTLSLRRPRPQVGERPPRVAGDLRQVHRGRHVQEHPGGEERADLLLGGAGQPGDELPELGVAAAGGRADLGVGARGVGLELELEHLAVGEQVDVRVAHRLEPVALAGRLGRPREQVGEPCVAAFDAREEQLLLRAEQAEQVRVRDARRRSAIFSVDVPCRPVRANSATATTSTASRRASADMRRLGGAVIARSC